MNSQEKSDVGNAILSIIEQEYHHKTAEIVAYTIGISEKIPAQASNEIQNALNHFAIAYTSSDLPSAQKQLALAREHLERACRDCLKICLVKQRASIDSLVIAIEDKFGIILGPARTRLKNIAKERDRILFLESRGKENVTELLSKLLDECNDLYEYFLDNYTIPSKSSRVRSRILRWLRRTTPGIAIGVIGSMIAAYIYAKLGLPTHP